MYQSNLSCDFYCIREKRKKKRSFFAFIDEVVEIFRVEKEEKAIK
jgi:hypothetical protein